MQAQRDHLNRNAGDVEVGVSRLFRPLPLYFCSTLSLRDPPSRARPRALFHSRSFFELRDFTVSLVLDH